jgi:hypothetical protein
LLNSALGCVIPGLTRNLEFVEKKKKFSINPLFSVIRAVGAGLNFRSKWADAGWLRLHFY